MTSNVIRNGFFQSSITSLGDIVHKVEALPDNLNKLIAIKNNQGSPCEGEKKAQAILTSCVELLQSVIKPPVPEAKQDVKNTENEAPEVTRRAGFYS